MSRGTIENLSRHDALWCALIFGLAALGWFYLIVRIMLDGTFVTRNGMRITRAENPIVFWFTLLLFLCGVLFASTLTCLLLLHALKLSH
jgi:hypothetical protein